jgi:hypothetical protein
MVLQYYCSKPESGAVLRRITSWRGFVGLQNKFMVVSFSDYFDKAPRNSPTAIFVLDITTTNIECARCLHAFFELTRMPKFAVGDHVERIGVLVPENMRHGIVTRVITNKVGQDLFYEYDVDFGNQVIGTFYEAELRLVKEIN